MSERARLRAPESAGAALDKRLAAQRRAGRERARASAVAAAEISLERMKCARTGEVMPDWVARLPDPIRARIKTLADADEYAQARDRRAAVSQLAAELNRRSQTAEMDPFSAMARGMVASGKDLRALAPTRQLAELGLGRGRNPAVLTRRQLAAACAWHHLWLETRFGAAAVDPARVKVDGGGGGDAELGLLRAAESAKRLKRLREAVAADGSSGRTKAELLVWVIEKDAPLKNFSIARLINISGRDQAHGARLLLLTDGLETVARQLGY
jgi:hypothetical protein